MKLSRQEFNLHMLPILLAQGFGVLCGIVGVKVTSQLVSPEDFGRYGIFLTFTTTGAVVVHAGLIKYVSRHWAGAENRAALFAGIYQSWKRKLPWLLLPAIGGGMVLGSPGAMAGIMIAAALLTLFAVVQAALQAARKNWQDCGLSAIGALTRTFGPPLLYFASGGQWFGLWLGFAGHALVTTASGLWALHGYWGVGKGKALPLATDPAYTGGLFVTLAITAWILNSMTRWLVAACFGAETAGHFTLASNVALIVPTVLGGIFIQYLQPVLFLRADQPEATHAGLLRFVDRMALSYTLVSLLGLVVLNWITPFLVGPIIDPAYLPALVWIFPAGCFGLNLITGQFYHTVLLAARRESACGPVDLVTAAVLVIGCGISAGLGETAFRWWLFGSTLIPWLVKRPLAHRALFKTA